MDIRKSAKYKLIKYPSLALRRSLKFLNTSDKCCSYTKEDSGNDKTQSFNIHTNNSLQLICEKQNTRDIKKYIKQRFSHLDERKSNKNRQSSSIQKIKTMSKFRLSQSIESLRKFALSPVDMNCLRKQKTESEERRIPKIQDKNSRVYNYNLYSKQSPEKINKLEKSLLVSRHLKPSNYLKHKATLKKGIARLGTELCYQNEISIKPKKFQKKMCLVLGQQKSIFHDTQAKFKHHHGEDLKRKRRTTHKEQREQTKRFNPVKKQQLSGWKSFDDQSKFYLSNLDRI